MFSELIMSMFKCAASQADMQKHHKCLLQSQEGRLIVLVLSNMRFRTTTSTYLRCFSGFVTFLSKLSKVVIRRETVSSPECAFFPSCGSNRRNNVSLVAASQTSSVALERIARSRGPKLPCFNEPNFRSRYSRMAGICGRSKQLPQFRFSHTVWKHQNRH